MKWHITLGLIAVLSLPLVAHAQTLQWQATNGPWGESVSGFVAKDSVIITAGTTGTYRSLNGGSAWQWVAGPSGPFAVGDSMIFAVGNDNGIYRSSDDGATWRNVISGSFSSVSASDSIVIALGAPIFRSTNSGDSWDTLPLSALSIRSVQVIVVTPMSMIAGTDSGMYRSTDTGKSWNEIRGLIMDSDIRLIVRSPSIIYAAGGAYASSSYSFYRNVFSSTNDGLSWSLANPVRAEQAISALWADDSTLYAIDAWETLFKSTDLGLSWTSIPIGGSYGNLSAVYGRDHLQFLATRSGVLRSVDSGTTWGLENWGIYAYGSQSLAATSDALLVGTAHCGIFRSPNVGGIWIGQDTGFQFSNDPEFDVNAIASSTSGVYVAASGVLRTNIFRSTDNGQSWAVASPDFGGGVLGLASVADTIYVGLLSGAQRSTDDGQNWVACGTLPENFGIVYDLKAAPGVVYASGRDNLYRSFDLGKSWTKIDTGSLGGAGALYAEGSRVYAAVDLSHVYGMLFRSTDYGSSWQKFTTIPAPIGSLVVNGKTFVAATQSGIYYSSDEGVTWSTENSGLSDSLDVYPILVIGSQLIASTSYHGVFVASLPHASVDLTIRTIGPDYNLFPNPTPDFVTLRYDGSSIPVTITITDVLGREVAWAFTLERSTDRAHEITFDLSQLPAGTYFVRIETGDGSVMRKVIRE